MKIRILVTAALGLMSLMISAQELFKSAEERTIQPGQPVEFVISAAKTASADRVILRFQARRNLLSGWDHCLEIRLNGIRLDAETGILRNREESFPFGKDRTMRFISPRGLLVFNTRDWGAIDGSIKDKAQRDQGCFMELDVTDWMQPDADNRLQLSVSGRFPVVLRNLSVKTVPAPKLELPYPDGSVAAGMKFRSSTRIPGIVRLAPKSAVVLKFPAVQQTGRVLRFQVRTEGDTGWNTMLDLKINGKALKIQKADGRSRLLNRGAVFSSKSWKNQSMATDSVYNVFFSRSFSFIDPSITDAAQHREGTWLVLDCEDLCGSNAVELTLKNEFVKPLLLRNLELGCLVPQSEQPMALQMELTSKQYLFSGTKVLKHGGSLTLPLPDNINPGNLLPVLRFQARMAYKELEGWGNYLNIKINDENLDEQDKYARSRLLNRNNFFAAAGHPDQALASRNNYLTFFTDDFDRINPKWIKDAAQLRENTWFVLRLDEMLKPGKGNTVTFTSRMVDPKFPYEVEIRNPEFGFLLPRKTGGTAVPKDFKPTLQIQAGKESFELSANGALRFRQGKNTVLLESFFSYPHAGKNLNSFNVSAERTGAPGWKPQIRKDNSGFIISAGCGFYRLTRKIKFTEHFIDFSDTYVNPGKDPVGIILKQQLYFGTEPEELRFGGIKTNPKFAVSNVGSPANPTIFAGFPGRSLGVMLIDTVSRAHMTAGGSSDGIHFGSEQLAVDPGAERTLKWRIYRVDGDYWDFINQVRRDIGANFTIPGYGQFSATTYQKPSPDCRFVGNFIQALDRKRPSWIMSAPWFCYYDASQCRTAEEWLQIYRRAQHDFDTRFAPHLKDAKLVPQFEPSLQAIPREISMTRYPEDKDKYDTDGLVVDSNSRYRFTRQWTVGKPVTNYRSYIVQGSKHYQKRKALMISPVEASLILSRLVKSNINRKMKNIAIRRQ